MMMRILLILLILPLSVLTKAGDSVILTGKAFEKPQYLPVDEAFMLTASRLDESIRLHWLVQPGYYLYRDRMKFPGFKNMPKLPTGKRKFDEIFGDVEVYYDELVIKLHDSSRSALNSSKIDIIYRGCAEAGLCYPPQKREIDLNTLQLKSKNVQE